MVVYIKTAVELGLVEKPKFTIRPGHIMFMGYEKSYKPTEGKSPPYGALNHPVVVLLNSTSEQKALVATISSLRGMSIKQKYPTDPEKRALVLPIYPCEPHPDTGERLEIEYTTTTLDKLSHVRLDGVYIAPWSIIKPLSWSGDPPRIARKSLALVMQKLPAWKWEFETVFSRASAQCTVGSAKACSQATPKSPACASPDRNKEVNHHNANTEVVTPPSKVITVKAPEPVRPARSSIDKDEWTMVTRKSSPSRHSRNLSEESNTSRSSDVSLISYLCEEDLDDDSSPANSDDDFCPSVKDADDYDEEKHIEGIGLEDPNSDEKQKNKDKKKRRRNKRHNRRGAQRKSTRNAKVCGIMLYLLLMILFLLYNLCELLRYVGYSTEENEGNFL